MRQTCVAAFNRPQTFMGIDPQMISLAMCVSGVVLAVDNSLLTVLMAAAVFIATCIISSRMTKRDPKMIEILFRVAVIERQKAVYDPAKR